MKQALIVGFVLLFLAVPALATVDGGPGDDRIIGTTSADVLRGGIGDDFINGRAGRDIILGGLGADTINGGVGRDTCFVDELDTYTSCEVVK